MSRGLKTKDVMAMSRIITKMDIKENLKKFVEASESKNASDMEIGMDLILGILGKASDVKVENELYAFAGGILEIEPAEVAEMDINKLIEKFKETADLEAWKSFFITVARLIIMK